MKETSVPMRGGRIRPAIFSRLIRTSTALFLGLATVSAFADSVPEILHYKFDGIGTTVPNLASTPPPGTANGTIIGGLTQTGPDLNASANGGSLVGNGGSGGSNFVNTGWATNLTGASWTISFLSSNVPSTGDLHYIFGDNGASSFRCFTGGVAGPGNWILRGPVSDVYANGGAATATTRTTFVYDITLSNIRAYVNGNLVATVPQGPLTISSAGPFKVGAMYDDNTGLPNGSLMDDFRIYNRALTPEEIADLDVPNGGELVDDAVTTGTGPTRVYPLANDPGAARGTTITGVTGTPGVEISQDGRSILVPAGFTGTLTYTAAGAVNGSAEIEVIAGTPAVAPNRFTGLLYDASGNIAGNISTNTSRTGFTTAMLMVNGVRGKSQFIFPAVETTTNPTTTLGAMTVDRHADGTLRVEVAAAGGPVSGILRPIAISAVAGRHHIALASIDTGIPGGGYAVVNVRNNGSIQIAGLLPDGRPLRGSTYATDNGTISFYTLGTANTTPVGRVAGELVAADLPGSDVTGEIAWTKPPQAPGARGTHLEGVDTVLTANGARYTGVIPVNGPSSLSLSGGGFEEAELTNLPVSAGVPVIPAVTPEGPNCSLRAWTSVRPEVGQFRARVLIPGRTSPVNGSGIYIPKADRAWGYFPGQLIGGRIDLLGGAELPN